MYNTQTTSFDAQVQATLGAEKYRTTIIADGKTIIGDEPAHLGGNNVGFNPYELLSSSLAMCTAATLRMYAERKAIELGNITVNVTLVNNTTEKQATFEKYISFENNELSEDIIKRLLAIADACPVNRLLSRDIVVNSYLG